MGVGRGGGEGTAAERRGNTLQGFKDFDLPYSGLLSRSWLSYAFRVCPGTICEGERTLDAIKTFTISLPGEEGIPCKGVRTLIERWLVCFVQLL